MGIHPGIILLGSICFIILIWLLFKDIITRVVLRITLGIGIMYLAQLLVPTYAIGINWLTVICAGALGIPGIGMLFGINYII